MTRAKRFEFIEEILTVYDFDATRVPNRLIKDYL